MENKVRKKKSPALLLRVTIDGMEIQEKNSTETFLACIKKFGAEKVASLSGIHIRRIPLVVRDDDYRLQMRKIDDNWFVCTHMPTIRKKWFLEKIAKELGVSINVELLQIE